MTRKRKKKLTRQSSQGFYESAYGGVAGVAFFGGMRSAVATRLAALVPLKLTFLFSSANFCRGD
jgi:hypothetical protein